MGIKVYCCLCSSGRGLAGPGDPSVLWNAMMYPLLQMTIYGAIWYQGESNAGECSSAKKYNYFLVKLNTVLSVGDPPKYNCTFPAMIADWRDKWYNTTGQTNKTFPFGFVQVGKKIEILIFTAISIIVGCSWYC